MYKSKSKPMHLLVRGGQVLFYSRLLPTGGIRPSVITQRGGSSIGK